MFDRSIRMLEKCADDARAFAYYTTLVTQGFFLIYYILLLSFSYGRAGINGALLALSAVALGFLLYTETPQGAIRPKISRWARICVRYARYCVHICAISLMLYSFYSDPAAAPVFALILLVFAILSFLIQLIAEIVGFLSRRYFEEILAAFLADTELLRSVLDKVQGGVDAIKSVKEGFASLPNLAAEKASALASGIKKKFSIFRREKSTPVPPMIEGKFSEQEKETADKN